MAAIAAGMKESAFKVLRSPAMLASTTAFCSGVRLSAATFWASASLVPSRALDSEKKRNLLGFSDLYCASAAGLDCASASVAKRSFA